MSQETKKIGDYTCFKATAVTQPSKTDFRNFRRKEDKKEDKKKKSKQKLLAKKANRKLKLKKSKKTNF